MRDTIIIAYSLKFVKQVFERRKNFGWGLSGLCIELLERWWFLELHRTCLTMGGRDFEPKVVSGGKNSCIAVITYYRGCFLVTKKVYFNTKIVLLYICNQYKTLLNVHNIRLNMHKVIKSNTNKKTVIKYKKTILNKKPTVTHSTIQSSANMLAFQKATYNQQYAIIQYIQRTNPTLYKHICGKLSVLTAKFYKNYKCNQTQLNNIIYAVNITNINTYNQNVNCNACVNVPNKYYKAQPNTLLATNIIKHAYN